MAHHMRMDTEELIINSELESKYKSQDIVSVIKF
jgi:hypothetical protein